MAASVRVFFEHPSKKFYDKSGIDKKVGLGSTVLIQYVYMTEDATE